MTALSRIIYQSQTLNGTLVPVSAYILWPFSPRTSPEGYQVVAWSHGTSGTGPDTAPSHQADLWQHYLGPFNLALQGYVVVATDHAGLGVSKTASGDPIVHEYLASPSQANDVFYSVQAAQEAFPELGKQFVIIGHSQGGGSAWAAAQRQAIKLVDGSLGAVAVSPMTSFLKEPDPIRSLLGFGMLRGVAAYFPESDMSDVLTEDGLERHAPLQGLDTTATTSVALLSDVQMLQSNWTENPYIRKYQALVLNGGKAIAKPLLVISGKADPMLNINVAAAAVQETLQKLPDAPLQSVRLPGVSHNAALTSSQRIWMDWIADRFAGKAADSSAGEMKVQSARPLDAYQPEANWCLSRATAFYQTP